MKKRLLGLAALLAAGVGFATLSAQTDVTSLYLTNPSFEADGHQNGNLVPTGWTLSESTGGYTSYRPIKSTITTNGNYTVTDGIKEGATDGDCFLHIRTNWGASVCRLTQTTRELPAGHYTLKADVYIPYSEGKLHTFTVTVKNGDVTNSVVAQKYNPIWRTAEVSFDVETEGTVDLELLHSYSGGGCESGDMTLVDNLRLIQYNYSSLSTLINKANELYDGSANGASAFASAIAVASSVSEAADINTVTEAIGALETAMEVFQTTQFVVPAESDYTSWITNASLETTSGGEIFATTGTIWSSSIPSGWKIARMVDGAMNTATHTGQSGNGFEVWGNSADKTAGILFQSINSLPAGRYTLSAYICREGKLFAKVGNGETLYSEENSSAENDWKLKTVSFVKDNTEDVVLIGGQTTAQWGIFDEFSLTCDGLDLTSLVKQRDALVEELQTYEGKVPSSYYANVIEVAINQADAANSEESLSSSITVLTGLVSNIPAIVSTFEKATDLIALCQSYVANSAVAIDGDKTDFENAITTAQNAINQAETIEELNAAIAALEAARQTYVLVAYPINDITFDLTFKITNAAIASKDGWTNANTNVNEQYTGAPDNTYFDIYNANCNMTQTISELPEGVYEVKAATRAHASVTTGNIYVEADGTTYRTEIHRVGSTGNDLDNGWGWTTVGDIMVSSGCIKIGFYAECTSSKWAGADDFSLTLVRAFTDEEKAAAYINTLNTTIAQAESLNTTTNVGEGAFQHSAASVAALQDAIATAKAVSSTDITTLVDAKDALMDAMEAYQLNAPGEGEVFNIFIRTNDGYLLKDLPVTFKEDGKAGMYFQTGFAQKHYAQYVIFTKVEGADQYIVSTIYADGTERFMSTGLTSGEDKYTEQIRLTADREKALVVKIIATDTEGIYHMANTESNNALIGCQDDGTSGSGGLYTNSDSHVNLALVSVEKPAVELTVTDCNFATVMLPYAAEIPQDLKVYTTSDAEAATADGNRVLVLTEATEIAANTPYIVEGTAGTYNFSGIGAAYKDAYTEGLLTGTFVETAATAGTYVLQTNEGITGFYRVAEGTEPTVGANRAYLTAPADDAAEVTAFVFESVLTGIQSVEAAADVQVDVYTIDGVRVREGVKMGEALKGLSKGIYVVNGAKKAVK